MEEEKGGGSRSSFEMYLIYIYIFLTKFDLDFVIHFKDLAESSVHPTCCAIDPPVGSTLIHVHVASLAATTFFTSGLMKHPNQTVQQLNQLYFSLSLVQ